MKASFEILFISLLVFYGLCLPPQGPIIGIYTEDSQLTEKNGYSTYIAASYVKNLQMAGAQVVPIFYHSSKQQLENLLSKIDGVFIPGGQMPIDIDNQWTKNIQYILQYANAQNLDGNVYPIWATCLGYETIMYLTSHLRDNMTVLTEVFGQSGKTCPQTIIDRNSFLLNTLTSAQLRQLTQGDGTMYFHHRWAVLLKTFRQNIGLTSFWKLISTSKTVDGTQFVSTVQAKNYPYLMTQYHPQKNAFQWRIPALRTYISTSTAQHFINGFVNLARLNRNQFPIQQLAKRIIYNYQPMLTPVDYDFVQVYIFDEVQELKKFQKYTKEKRIFRERSDYNQFELSLIYQIKNQFIQIYLRVFLSNNIIFKSKNSCFDEILSQYKNLIYLNKQICIYYT